MHYYTHLPILTLIYVFRNFSPSFNIILENDNSIISIGASYIQDAFTPGPPCKTLTATTKYRRTYASSRPDGKSSKIF